MPEKTPEEKPKGRPKGAKDKKPRKTDGYKAQNKPWKNNPVYMDSQKQFPEGYNAQKIDFYLKILPDKNDPLDLNDVDKMEQRFYRYLQLCAQYDQKVGNQAAYAAMGLTKEQVWDFTNRNKTNPARSDLMKKIQQICGMYREGLMEDGQINNITGIFWQKNYDGMKDQTDIVVTPNQNPLGEGQNAEQLAEKYLEQAKGIEQKDIIDMPISAHNKLQEPEKN